MTSEEQRDTLDIQVLRFSELKDCGFLRDGNGRILCQFHDDPFLGGMHGYGHGTRAPKCEERKKWLDGFGVVGTRFRDNHSLQGLLRRAELPVWVQMAIAELGGDWLGGHIARRADLAPEVQIRIANDKSARRYLIGRDDLRPEVVVLLAEDDDWEVRYSIAKRMGLLPELQARVEKDKQWLAGEVSARLGIQVSEELDRSETGTADHESC